MKIHFYLRFSTKPGQDLYICGNIPELGYLNKLNTEPVLMKYKSADFWEIIIELPGLPVDPIQYYYQLKMEDGSMVQHTLAETISGIDPEELNEWFDSLEDILHRYGPERLVHFLRPALPRHIDYLL